MTSSKTESNGPAGTPEINMGDLKVDVLPGHIRKAEKGSCSHCPVAVATKEAGKHLPVSKPIVDQATIRFSVGNTRYIFATPNIAQTFLHDYDVAMQSGVSVDDVIARFKPFRFWLRQLRAMQITHASAAKARKTKKTIRVTADKRKKSKTRRPRKMVAAPTIIGGKALPTLASRKRIHGIRAYQNAQKHIWKQGNAPAELVPAPAQ